MSYRGRPVIVHIPARSGSTRVKKKNIREVGGLPLMAYSILLAKQLPQVDRVIVNTDSEEFAAIAREYGAETPFLRPSELSTEKAAISDAGQYLKTWLLENEAVYPAKMITLYPTSPFRNAYVLREAIRQADYCQRVASVLNVDLKLEEYCVRRNGSFALFADHMTRPFEDGCYIKGVGQFLVENLHLPMNYYISTYRITNPIELVDLDVEEDFELAEYILKEKLYDFGCDLFQ